MSFFSRITPAILFLAASIQTPGLAAVVTTDPATQCAAGLRADPVCDDIRIHPWSGTLELALGFDAAFAARTADAPKFSIRAKPSDTTTTSFKNEGTESIRAGITVRLEILEKFGAGFTAGFEGNSGDASLDGGYSSAASGSYPLAIEYSGPYVETAIYLPVQRWNTWGLVIGARRLLTNKATLTYEDYSGKTPSEYRAEQAPQEVFAGFFGGPFYFNLVKRKEEWSSDYYLSRFDNSGSGFEFGLSGPVSVIFPR